MFGVSRERQLLLLLDVWSIFLPAEARRRREHRRTLERENHRVFMHLENGRAYSLPENVEILDKSLDDIRKVLFPKFTSEEIAA